LVLFGLVVLVVISLGCYSHSSWKSSTDSGHEGATINDETVAIVAEGLKAFMESKSGVEPGNGRFVVVEDSDHSDMLRESLESRPWLRELFDDTENALLDRLLNSEPREWGIDQQLATHLTEISVLHRDDVEELLSVPGKLKLPGSTLDT
jgi:hypothetical protein